jgi:hypothetical protein
VLNQSNPCTDNVKGLYYTCDFWLGILQLNIVPIQISDILMVITSISYLRCFVQLLFCNEGRYSNHTLNTLEIDFVLKTRA